MGENYTPDFDPTDKAIKNSLKYREVCIYILDVQNHHKQPTKACEIIQQMNDERVLRGLTELIFPTKKICKEAQDAANKLQFSDKSGLYFSVISDKLEISFADIENESWLFSEVKHRFVGIIFIIKNWTWKLFVPHSRQIFRSEVS